MNKRVNLFLFVLILSLVTPLVSAQSFNLGSPEDFMRDAIEGVRMVFRPIAEVLLGEGLSEDLYLAKVLLFILLFSVIFLVLKRVPMFENNRKVSIIVAGVVSIFGVRFISEDGLIAGILLPYQTLAVAITTFLPFMIYFWFVHDAVQGSTGRRIAWILYGVVFTIFFISRWYDISSFSKYIYIFGIIAIILASMFDRSIHGYFGTAKTEKMKRRFKRRQLADIEADLNKFRAITNPSRETQLLIRQLEHRYAEILREI